MYLRREYLAPKAKVTGPNPVGRANVFDWLPRQFHRAAAGQSRQLLHIWLLSIEFPELQSPD